jgi:UDP-glucose 4-epimerase
MRAAVVGGSGFVGRHVVERLLEIGEGVVNVDRRAPQAPGARERYLSCDLASAVGPEDAALGSGTIDVVVWLAALGSGGRASVDATSLDEIRVMVEAPLRYLAALEPPPSSFVYFSSVQVYGAPRRLPVDEDHETEPQLAYGVAKLCAESYLEIACRDRAIPLATLRPAFIYGPGQNPENAIPKFLAALRRDEPPRVFGAGSGVRDDVYVADVARATELAIAKRASGVFNVATGRPHSLLEVAETACRVSGKPLRPVHAPEEGSWIDRWFAVDRAERALGFSASTSLEEGLRAMWEAGP